MIDIGLKHVCLKRVCVVCTLIACQVANEIITAAAAGSSFNTS